MARPRAQATAADHRKGARTVPKSAHVAPAKRSRRAEPALGRAKDDLASIVVPGSRNKFHIEKVPFDVLDFKKAFHSSSSDRLQVIKAGVPAKKVHELAGVFKISQDEMIHRLGLTKSTVSRKVKADEALTADQSERVVGMSKLLGLVEAIVSESGEQDAADDFDAAAWLEDWLSHPNPALGGVLPSTYLDTREGQEILSTLISQMQSGAYA